MKAQPEQEDRLNTEGSDRLANTLVINCGRALARAVDEQDLLQSVCNTLVNNCGFRLAWFGLTEPGTSNSIRLIAQAGDQDGFLQEPRCFETPATLAIQAGETCCIKAIADSPLVVPVRAAALKRGYTSVLSLPLKSDGTLFGALTIYADDPGKLDEAIVERLREWSGLFALRVKTLRSHEERDGSDALNNDLQNIADRQGSENRLRLIIDTTPALIHSARPDGYIDYFNKPWLEYLGVTLEDVEGWKWTASIHPDDVTGIVDKWRACLASGEIFEYETRVRRADGEYRRMLHRKVPLRDQDGNVVKWYGSSIDIEEIKRAEEELRRSEAYLAEAQRLTHAGSWAYKPDLDRLVHCSDELFRIYGFDPQEHVPTLEEIRNRVHPEDRDRVRQNREKQFAEKGEYVEDYRVVLPDGAVRHVHMIGHPILDETGDLVEYVGTAMDVTERKRAEEAVLRSEKELRNVIETIPTSVWTALPDGTVDFVSRDWREHSGLLEESPYGTGWQTAVHPEDIDRHLDKWRVSLATGAPFENEARRRAANGEYRWFLARAVPLRDEQGNILKWYGITMEIEDRKRAEEAFRTAQIELAHVTRVATLGEMTASIAHEINQPLGALVNNAGACLGWLDAGNLEEARNSVALMMDDAQRASEIITRIRALVKKAPPQKDWLDINQSIREVIGLGQSEVQRNHIALETQLSDDVPLVFADRIQLQQVMLNLMMNAIEAMTQVTTARELLISSGADDSKGVVVVVRDSGPGLDSKSLERLFEPFYTTKPQGMGMGLTISRSIVEAHDGRLWATTNEDRGATFHFTLPIVEETQA
jgi:PAS domain S-box-containing protein